LITCSSIQLDRRRKGEGKEQTGGGHGGRGAEAAMSFIGVVVGLGEEGDAVATGRENCGGAV
jgi:hypothetical protein